MYAIYHSSYGWQIIRIDRGIAHLVAAATDQATAERIRDLLDRHGMTDVPLHQVEATDAG